MKKITIITLLSLFSFLTSCEKEVILNLEDSGEKFVIEGIITNNSNIQTIKINKSVQFYDSNNYPTVSNAVVKVSENGKTPITFTETSSGIYQATNFVGIPGYTYTLSITIEGVEYTSSSTMPQIVPLIEVIYEENTFNPPGQDPNYMVTPIFLDPVNSKNFYRFNLITNDIKDKSFFTLNDDLINGQINSFGLASSNEDNAIILGSKVKIEMLGIDKNVYNYFYVLEQNSDSQNTPNNPKSNINNNALGYFSAQNKQELTITIQ
jgi:hypothetical protein